MKKVLVDLEDLIRLEKRSLKLEFLECGGVDNWDGYGESLNPDYNDDCVSYDDEAGILERQLIADYDSLTEEEADEVCEILDAIENGTMKTYCEDEIKSVIDIE